MAARRTYYNIKLRSNKLKQFTLDYKDILVILEQYPGPSPIISSTLTKVKSTTRALIENFKLNPGYYHRPLTEKDPIVIAFAIQLQPLNDAVEESKIYIERCPRITEISKSELGCWNRYQLDLMIRYYDDSHLEKFEKILHDLYEYSHVEYTG